MVGRWLGEKNLKTKKIFFDEENVKDIPINYELFVNFSLMSMFRPKKWKRGKKGSIELFSFSPFTKKHYEVFIEVRFNWNGFNFYFHHLFSGMLMVQ